MGNLAIDGLISGLDTTTLINNLIQVEAIQQTLLKTKQSAASSTMTALQSLNTKVASLAAAAKAATTDSSWQAVKAKSSTDSVTASTTTGAQASSVSFSVDAVARSQSTLYTLPDTYSSQKPTFTLTQGGKTTTVTALSDNIGDIVAAFNADGTGVRASAVNVGTSSSPVYKLQLTGTETGEDATFSITADNAIDPTTLVSQQLRTASDAKITLWPGTAGATQVTSSTNTFTGLLTGVDITVSAVTTDPVTVDVTRDDAALSTLASNLVANLNTVLSEIASRTASTTSTAEDGGTLLTGGLLSGNSTIRFLQQDLLASGSLESSSTSPASVGIVLNKDGTFTFDAEAFAAALTADPAGVQKLVSSIGAELQTVADRASDSVTGSITAQITSQESLVGDLGDQIDSWDVRLEMRRATLEKTYANLEVMLSNLQSQSAYLTQQFSTSTSSS